MKGPTSNQDLPERRKHLRNSMIVLKVTEGAERPHFFGYTRNVSREGLFIESINPRNPGERFVITFQIPDTAIKVRCQCEVVWIRPYRSKSKEQSGYGVKFLDIPEPVAISIDEWIKEQG